MTEGVQERKAALRTQVLARRTSRSDVERSRAEAAIARLGVDACRGMTTVAAYVSFGAEPPTAELLRQLSAAGSEILLPVVEPDGLHWARYAGPDEMVAGPFGVPEPIGTRLPPGAVTDAGTVFVPALAVDRPGNRLGRGGGYYDRALAGIRAQVVAVIYDDELIDTVPHEAHDRAVDAMLRPQGLSTSTRS